MQRRLKHGCTDAIYGVYIGLSYCAAIAVTGYQNLKYFFDYNGYVTDFAEATGVPVKQNTQGILEIANEGPALTIFNHGTTMVRAVFIYSAPLVVGLTATVGFLHGFNQDPYPRDKRFVITKMLKIKNILFATQNPAADPEHAQEAQIFSAWLTQGEGQPFQQDVARFSDQFKKLLIERKAKKSYQNTIFGNRHRYGLIESETGLLDRFLDRHPPIFHFLLNEFDQRNGLLERVSAAYQKLQKERDQIAIEIEKQKQIFIDRVDIDSMLIRTEKLNRHLRENPVQRPSAAQLKLAQDDEAATPSNTTPAPRISSKARSRLFKPAAEHKTEHHSPLRDKQSESKTRSGCRYSSRRS